MNGLVSSSKCCLGYDMLYVMMTKVRINIHFGVICVLYALLLLFLSDNYLRVMFFTCSHAREFQLSARR